MRIFIILRYGVIQICMQDLIKEYQVYYFILYTFGFIWSILKPTYFSVEGVP